jgi:RHH-type proline utilization regulon transcriptional repressor/proline dehydrogenase/delta 1-pyrroline-5-carboxylate dehydrogenase
MTANTIGVTLDTALMARLDAAASAMGRTPQSLVEYAVLTELQRVESARAAGAAQSAEVAASTSPASRTALFLEFARSVQPQSVLRAKITAAYRSPETDCLPLLVSDAVLASEQQANAAATAQHLILALREVKRDGGSGVEALTQEYSLSSNEGVALMCLAEALLRIPDRATRDALIRDKISRGDWQSHIGQSASIFVNAATWGLVVTGKLTATNSETGLMNALSRLIGLGGEPLIRKGVNIAMRMMGEQFVTGQTIGEALANSRRMESRGFRYSYDMLGEAAVTRDDALRYFHDYEHAVQAIGKAANRRGIYEGAGISVKLSALHPRYSRAQRERVMEELYARLKSLAVGARSHDIGFNIDAEEAERLDLSLDLLERLCLDTDLAGWNGIGFAVQAYQKRALSVIEWAIDLARRSRRRLMIRLVKGAYWDSEIKRAQVDGMEDFPVFTRKIHTDVSYLACSRKLLSAPDAVYPQFATHNALTVAAVMQMAGPGYYPGQYEFQCLHGMGEPLYEKIVGSVNFNRPCRIYAPVGTHETLLAYLVRRLLENGANSSFVNRVADPEVSTADLLQDPVTAARRLSPIGLPNLNISHPRDLFGTLRPNSIGIDLSNEQRLASLATALLIGAQQPLAAKPLIGDTESEGAARPVCNPADDRDVVGWVTEASLQDVEAACSVAAAAAPIWDATPVTERAATLWRAAEVLETRMSSLMSVLSREAGKSLPNAIAEVREAIDFLRYYSVEARSSVAADARSLGPVACISPWNFPLAIFTGQIAAALAVGNSVLAKPAEETPLIASIMVQILRQAGVPTGVLQLLPGDGTIGAALVADTRIRGVLFTGSTAAARSIQRSLATRLTPEGSSIPLVAETGGQNALIVDSSALPEQVVGDVLSSAFDSAGQRCSALRILCLQEEIADRVLVMLKGAMQELTIGSPNRLNIDIGPVITAEAKAGILAHISAMRDKGREPFQMPVSEALSHGHFVAPTLIEIEQISELQREVFGPVLHVVRYKREKLEELLAAVNATGYGLTFGLHTRLDETIAFVSERIGAGNLYINRNIIGAVVGVQPFGGHYLSGTGPKAGGPRYLGRLVSQGVISRPSRSAVAVPAALTYRDSLIRLGFATVAARVTRYIGKSSVGVTEEFAGPVGERNLYRQQPRGAIAALAQSEFGLLMQVGAILASGNRAIVVSNGIGGETLASLPESIQSLIVSVPDWRDGEGLSGLLFEGDADAFLIVNQAAAALGGPIISVQGASVSGLSSGAEEYCLDRLMYEVSISINTAAAGGNASLMTLE